MKYLIVQKYFGTILAFTLSFCKLLVTFYPLHAYG